MCLAMNAGPIGSPESGVPATSNRNFEGRQGRRRADASVVSPANGGGGGDHGTVDGLCVELMGEKV